MRHVNHISVMNQHGGNPMTNITPDTRSSRQPSPAERNDPIDLSTAAINGKAAEKQPATEQPGTATTGRTGFSNVPDPINRTLSYCKTDLSEALPGWIGLEI